MHVSPSGKRYVGLTSQDVERRWRANGEGYNQPSQRRFMNAIRKYGWVNFTHIVLMSGLSYEEAASIERLLIANNKTTDPAYGYNVTNGGEGPLRWTQEMRDKLSRARKGLPGWRHTEESRKRIGDANRGRKASPATLMKMSSISKAYYNDPKVREAHSLRHVKVSRCVAQLEVGTGKELHRFRSLGCAAKALISLGVTGRAASIKSHISESCHAVERGRHEPRVVKGYWWRFV